MSFGVGVGDIIIVCRMAFQLVSSIRAAPEELESLATELQTLKHCVKAISEHASTRHDCKIDRTTTFPVPPLSTDARRDFNPVHETVYGEGWEPSIHATQMGGVQTGKVSGADA